MSKKLTKDIKAEQQDPFRLASMAQLDPPVDLWPEIEKGLGHGASSRYPGWQKVAGLAAVLVMTFLIWQQPSNTPKELDTSLPVAQAQNDTEPTTATDHLERLVSISQQMESLLASYRDDQGGVSSEHASMVAEFEDLIAYVDQQLADHPDSTDLWYQRVSLMSDLMGVYTVQANGEMGMIASL